MVQYSRLDNILLLSFFLIIICSARILYLALPFPGAQQHTRAPFWRMKACLLKLLPASSGSYLPSALLSVCSFWTARNFLKASQASGGPLASALEAPWS